MDRPLQVFHVEVEVKDINDNPPRFLRQEQTLFILESRRADSRFPLEGASDMDIGRNAELRYKLQANEYFDLDVKTNEEETNFLELVLKKPVDREEMQEHRLLLIAIDGLLLKDCRSWPLKAFTAVTVRQPVKYKTAKTS